MKKWIVIFVLIMLSTPFWNHSRASEEGIPFSEIHQKNPLYNWIQPQHMKQIGKIIILPEYEYNYYDAAMIIQRIDALPLSLLKKIVENDVRILLFEGKLTDQPSAHHLKGLLPRGYQGNTTWDDVPGMGGSNTVMVKIGHSDKGEGHGSINLELHELAHSIDLLVFNGVRFDPQFLKIWASEKENLFPRQPYFINYPEEYFAEVFALYYYSPITRKLIQVKAPNTYKYLKTAK